MTLIAAWILIAFGSHPALSPVHKLPKFALHKGVTYPVVSTASRIRIQPSNAAPATTTDTAPTKTPEALPPTFFGLTVLDTHRGAPGLRYGTTRTWDSSPATDWADTNPLPGRYNFKSIDEFFAANKSKDVIFTLGRTPQWASSLPNAQGPYGPGQCAPPENLATWGAYLRAVAKYVHGRTHYWELWNEPDGQQFYCGAIVTMAEMAQHAHSILKEIDPQAVLLSPGVTLDLGPKWLDSFLAAGGGANVDVIAFHGYWGAVAEDIESIITNYQSVLQHHGLSAKPMWDTEISWAGNGHMQTPSNSDQAAYISKSYLLQWSRGIQRVVWYAYDASTKDGGLRGSGKEMTTSARAYDETYRWLQGASLSSPCSRDKGGMWSCSLTRPGGYQAQVVWNSNSTTNFSPDASFHEYRDLAGTIHPLSGAKVSVGSLPILLETRTIPFQ